MWEKFAQLSDGTPIVTLCLCACAGPRDFCKPSTLQCSSGKAIISVSCTIKNIISFALDGKAARVD